jgi:uncharacterized protein with GYD domain
MLETLTTGLQEYPRALERYGGKNIIVYAVVGRYDAAVIVDFDDYAAVLAFGLAATAQGQYVEALPVYSAEDVARAEEIARSAFTSLCDEVAKFANAAPPTPIGTPEAPGRGPRTDR